MGASYELTATAREKVGKGAARSVRRQGRIPAVIYGGNKPPIAISLDWREVNGRIHGGGFYTSVATIAVDGERIPTLPRDFQLDPVSERPVHVDFLRVVPGAEVTVDVPVRFINEGQAPGIRRGGVLNIVRHRVALVCPLDAIPESITGDLTGLEIGDSLHISAITLPPGTRTAIRGRDFTVASVAAAAGVKEEMRAALEAAAAAKAAAAAAAEAGIVEGEEAATAEGAAAAAPGAEAKPGAPGAEAKPAAGKAEPAKGKPEAGKGKPEAGKKG
jgi:large subunit ribosomal protein L25